MREVGNVLPRVAWVFMGAVLSCGGRVATSDLISDQGGWGGAANGGGAAGAPGTGGSEVGGMGGVGGGPCAGVDLQTDPHNCGECGHDCKVGTCAAGMCQPEALAEDAGDFAYLTHDDGHLYWASSVKQVKLARVAKAGGAKETIYTGAEDLSGMSLSGDSLILALHSGSIVSVPTTGAAQATLMTDEPQYPKWPLVHGKFLFYIDSYVMKRMALADASVLVLSPEHADPLISMVADDTHLYWGDFYDTALFRLSQQGGTREKLAGLSRVGLGMRSLVLRNGYLYFADSMPPSRVKRMGKSGGVQTTLAEVDKSDRIGRGLAVDEAHVYWSRGADEYLDNATELRKVPVTGGTSSTIATFPPEAGLRELVDDAAWLYFAAGGKLWRLAK